MRCYRIFFLLAMTVFFSSTHAAMPAPSLTVEIYTIPGCMGCAIAKSLLEDQGIPYKEISLQGRPDLYAEMKRRAGGNPEESMTVPRVFINGKYIGGLSALRSFDFNTARAGRGSTAGG